MQSKLIKLFLKSFLQSDNVDLPSIYELLASETAQIQKNPNNIRRLTLNGD